VKGIAVTLHRYSSDGSRDAHGHAVATYDSEVVQGCAFKPGQTSESTQGSEQVTSAATIYVPPGTDASPLDRFEYPPGEMYEVYGAEDAWVSPFTGLVAPEAYLLRQVTGGSAHTSTAGPTGAAASGGG
jgi:hypothetical protein